MKILITIFLLLNNCYANLQLPHAEQFFKTREPLFALQKCFFRYAKANQTNYTNANLQANNININTQEDTTIKGANLNAEDTLTLNTKNLEVSSVQNTTKSKSHGEGFSAGFGASGLTSLGVNTSSGSSNSKDTLLTTLTGNNVDVTVAEDTKLRGATIAAVDNQGNDNSNLTLKTNTLTASSLNNTYSSKSTSVGINLSGATDKAQISNVGIDYSNDRTNSKTKTLATLGSGNIQISDTENSDTKMLNTDVANNEVDIYNISSHKGLKGELDTRLLTEDGRKQIKEDFTKTSFIATSLIEAATQNSVSLVGDRASGVTNFFENVKNKNDLLEGTKKFVNDPKNAQARDTLLNPNANPQEVQQANQQLHIYVAKEMGITPAELELILDKQYQGFTSSEDGKTRVAANLHNTMGDMANTTLNETSDVADLQRDKGIVKNENYVTNRDEYSTNFGVLGQDLLDDQYSTTTGTSINNVAYNKVGTDLSKPDQLNKTVIANTQTFNALDKSLGAHRQLNSTEVNFLTNEKNIEEFAKIKYNTDNPTSQELQGAEHSLVQEGLRGVDKAWSLVLGTDTDTQAREYLSQNSDAFKVKDAYEFKDGTTNGEVEVSDLSNQDYEKLKTLYQNNIPYKTKTNQEGTRFLGEEFQADTEQTLSNLKNIGTQEINQAIRDFVPNTIEAIADTPKTANSAKNYLENVLPTTTQERMNELYMQGDAGSKTQANLATMDAIGTASMVTGAGAVGKSVASSVGNSAVKSVDDSLDVNINSLDGTETPNSYKNLSGDETRDIYKDWVDSIDTNLEPTKENAIKVSQERAKFKQDARELMKDEDAAQSLPPVEDFNYYQNKYSSEPYNLKGEDLWKKIIEGSTKTNKEYNAKYGTTKNE